MLGNDVQKYTEFNCRSKGMETQDEGLHKSQNKISGTWLMLVPVKENSQENKKYELWKW